MRESVYIRVRAKPESKKEMVEMVSNNSWKICVREKAERGSANARIRMILAERLGVDPKRVRLAKGATSPSKLFLLSNHSSI